MVHVDRSKLPRYPFVNSESLNRNWIKLPFYYVASKLLSIYSNEEIEGLKDNPKTLPKQKGKRIFSDFFRNMVGAYIVNLGQKFETVFFETFPKLAVWNEFSKGSSNIESLYTVEFGGYEIPIFAKSTKSRDPTKEDIRNGIAFVKKERKSPLNGPELGEHYSGSFSKAAQKYTRGDYQAIIDPIHFNKWFVRDCSWLIQQYGKKTVDEKITLDGETFSVRAYNRPSRWETFLYWVVGDKTYDYIDMWFDPIQDQLERLSERGLVPDAWIQDLVKREYKTISGVRRGLFNPRYPLLEFDLLD